MWLKKNVKEKNPQQDKALSLPVLGRDTILSSDKAFVLRGEWRNINYRQWRNHFRVS